MTVIKWEAPPGSPVRLSNSSHLAIAAQLRARPGEWAHILSSGSSTSARTMAYGIKAGNRRAWLPAGAFEAVSRTVEGENRVYARYVGSGDE